MLLTVLHTTSAVPSALAATGGPVLDLPAIAVGWGVATWLAARWLSPTRRLHADGGGTTGGGSTDGAPQEPAYAGPGEHHRGDDQGEQHDRW